MKMKMVKKIRGFALKNKDGSDVQVGDVVEVRSESAALLELRGFERVGGEVENLTAGDIVDEEDDEIYAPEPDEESR